MAVDFQPRVVLAALSLQDEEAEPAWAFENKIEPFRYPPASTSLTNQKTTMRVLSKAEELWLSLQLAGLWSAGRRQCRRVGEGAADSLLLSCSTGARVLGAREQRLGERVFLVRREWKGIPVMKESQGY